MSDHSKEAKEAKKVEGTLVLGLEGVEGRRSLSCRFEQACEAPSTFDSFEMPNEKSPSTAFDSFDSFE